MPTAFPVKRASRARCKWNPRGCIRFRVRSRFPRVDRLPESQAASHAACLKYKFPLPSYLSVRQPMAVGTRGKVGWSAHDRRRNGGADKPADAPGKPTLMRFFIKATNQYGCL